MIIECINCNKKFNVNSELIPSSGRAIQCGSCEHVWFFDPKKVNKKIEKKISSKISTPISKEIKKKPTKRKYVAEITNKKNYELTEYKSKKSFTLSQFLSYILVLIITFIASIIIIDTFSDQFYKFFPNLELMIFSLFETLKDIKLFIKDLI